MGDRRIREEINLPLAQHLGAGPDVVKALERGLPIVLIWVACLVSSVFSDCSSGRNALLARFGK